MSDRGYTVTLTDSEYDALKARIAQLEAALRSANGDFKAYWIATGDPAALTALKRTEVALGLTAEKDE